MPSKKRVRLQQVDIIDLPNPDLTYIRNPKKKTKICLCPSTSRKLTYQKSFSFLYFFFHPPTYKETMIRARIYTRGEVSFAKFLFCKFGLPNCWRLSFLILPKFPWLYYWWILLGSRLARIIFLGGFQPSKAI
jgi:hypothetical protein